MSLAEGAADPLRHGLHRERPVPDPLPALHTTPAPQPLASLAPAASARRPGPPRLLLLATLFGMPYRVLRCAQAAGAHVWVCGTAGARGLRLSRHCRAFVPTGRAVDGRFDAGLADELNAHIERLDVDLILPGDAPSTRSLIAIREHLHTACFPMPQLEQFDRLNNKWEFTQLCATLQIRCPRTWLFEDTRALARALALHPHGALIAKPLALDGGLGVIRLGSEHALSELQACGYRPILVQDFIDGADIGASALCEAGAVRTFIAHGLQHHVYTACFDGAICRDVSRIARHLHITGLLNFDLRLTPDGQVFYLECNPRIFWKITMSMLAGINFIAAALPGAGASQVPARLPQPVAVRFPRAMLRALPTPWKLDRTAWRTLRFLYSDPVPHLREQWGLEHDAGRQYSGEPPTPPAPAAPAP